MYLGRGTRWFLRIGTGLTLAFIYLPLIIIALYAFNSRRTQTWPIPGLTFDWFDKAWHNHGARDALLTSVKAGLGAPLISSGALVRPSSRRASCSVLVYSPTRRTNNGRAIWYSTFSRGIARRRTRVLLLLRCTRCSRYRPLTRIWFVGRQSTQGTLSVHARPDPTVLEDLEEVVRRSGLEIERQASRRENVDVVIEYTLRGPKRLHDEVMIALLHHASVRTVSTGE